MSENSFISKLTSKQLLTWGDKPSLSGTNTVTTARHLLHTAAVCRAAACHPSHDCGAAQRDARCHVRPAHSASSPQRRGHGNGRGHHYGHVCWWAPPDTWCASPDLEPFGNDICCSSRDLVDDSIASTRCPPPSHDAYVSDPWHA